MASLSTTMASLRRAESGSFEGKYNFSATHVGGQRKVGAYGILERNWKNWASAAGIPGADIRSRTAQDRVAAFVLDSYYRKYGSWDLAVTAWYGGEKSADAVVRKGGKMSNASLARLVKKVGNYQRLPQANMYPYQGKAASARAKTQVGSGGFAFPVAGANEWSGGSYMAKHTKGDRSHYAIDIYAKKGTPIIAPTGGTITRIGKDPSRPGGNKVTVKGNDGRTYYFAHLDKHADGIAVGQKIMTGAYLGTVGNTGPTAKRTSPHLHFSIKDAQGNPINPTSYLKSAEAYDGKYHDAFGDEYIPGLDGPDLGAGAASYAPSLEAQGFGNSLPEAMIQAAAQTVAGGTQVDARLWVDPDEKPVDIETGIARDVDELDLEENKELVN